jgi:hypothetical protein
MVSYWTKRNFDYDECKRFIDRATKNCDLADTSGCGAWPAVGSVL